MTELSERLKHVADQIHQGEIVADIGSDHAYLPIYLLHNNISPLAIAGEVAEGPFNRAKNEVRIYHLEEKIDVRFGNGMDIITSNDHIDAFTICGMGGVLIASIIKKGITQNVFKHNERLILQPNVGEFSLRKYLQSIQYKITDEKIIEENNKIYEIITAVPSKSMVDYSNDEIKFGPFLMKEKSDTFIKKWKMELEKSKKIYKQIQKSNKDHSEKLELLQEEIRQIEEMLE